MHRALLVALAFLLVFAREEADVAASRQQELADAAWRQGDFDRAEALAKAALSARERRAPNSLEVAESLNLLGHIARRRGDMDAAEALGRRALAIRRRLAPDSLDEAASLGLLGRLAQLRGDADAAERLFRRQKDLAEALAPGGLEVAIGIYHLAGVANLRGDVELAEAQARRSLEIQERLAPGSLEVAHSLNLLGLVQRRRGDLAGAEEHHWRSLAIFEKLAPGSLDRAAALNNLAIIASERGDLELAEASYRRCLRIQERVAPGSADVAGTLNNLGAVLYQRGELEAAEAYYRDSLKLYDRLAPDSLDVAMELSNLSHVATDRGAFAEAEAYARRAVEIAEKEAPGSLDLAENLNTAGHAALARGDFEQAQEDFERDLRLTQELAPESLAEATSLSNLGPLLARQGRTAEAEAQLERALRIQERLAPGSSDQADTLYQLGVLRLASGHGEQALDAFRRTVALLETQIGRLGGMAEDRAEFRARRHHYYWDLQDLLIRRGRPEEAFHVLERSRSRGLLAMLAERDLAFAAELPEELGRARWQVAAGYGRARQALAEADPRQGPAEIEALTADLRRLRTEAAEIEARTRREAPKLAALQYPQPLGFREAQKALDPGTVMLSYSVGPERTHLFVISSEGPIETAEIPFGGLEWRSDVERLRALVQGSRSGITGVGAARREALDRLCRRLHERLLGPAEASLARGERILILPDGPLHALPWGALVREDGQYLIEWRPFHVAASATVHAELKEYRRGSGRGPGPGTLVAFGDPARREPLPATRAEVGRLAVLFSPDARIYLGEQATEKRARSIGRGARYVHFATHGVLDERSPLSSGLVLAQPAGGPDDGLLQAWEIFEGVRLDADLVVLSACESGLGRELPGEGLLGLTRAFQYAGAHAVAASLWKVSDRSAGELMVRFYRHLRRGRAKDEALREAQRELLRGGAAAPFDWAAFQIFGDAR